MSRYWVRVGVVLVLLIGFLTACGSKSSSNADKPRIGGTLVDLSTFGRASADEIDPNITDHTEASQIDGLLFDSLTKLDAQGNIDKEVASDYSGSDNATTWTFTLRSDVRFSDGSPVLASSFKRSWERVLNPAVKSRVSYKVQQIAPSPDATTLDNVTVDDAKRTITIKLSHPESDIPALLSGTAFSPIPASAPNDDTWKDQVMIGNGPYKLTSVYKTNETLKLVRNDSYAGDGKGKHPYLDALEFDVFKDSDSAYNDFAAGHGDVAYFPATATADLQKYHKEDIIDRPLMAVEAFGFNLNNPILAGPENLKLRQAIDLAIDKADINTKIFDGTHQPASQFSPSAVPGAQPKSTDGKPDIEKAKQLLKDWGKTPPQLKVTFAESTDTDLINLIVDDLKAVGIPAVPDKETSDDYYEKIGAGAFDFFRFQWVADYPSYQAMLEPTFDSANLGSEDVYNYKNSDVDDLFAKAAKSASGDDQSSYFRQAEQKILEDQPYVPIDWVTANLIKNPNVKGLDVDAVGYVNFESAWLAPPA